MAIKVIVNYPKTEEGLQLLEERKSEVLAKSLIKILSTTQIDELISKLRENRLKEFHIHDGKKIIRR